MTTKTVSLLLAGSILLTSCSSTTLIQSNPSGAKVYLNDEPVGKTPYKYTDTKIVGSTTVVKLEKEGYDPLIASFSRNEEVDAGAVVGGIFFWFPFLWTMKYKPNHMYELIPSTGTEQPPVQQVQQNLPSIKSKAERLREFKQLLDEKVITQEEFEKEKKKILEEEEK